MDGRPLTEKLRREERDSDEKWAEQRRKAHWTSEERREEIRYWSRRAERERLERQLLGVAVGVGQSSSEQAHDGGKEVHSELLEPEPVLRQPTMGSRHNAALAGSMQLTQLIEQHQQRHTADDGSSAHSVHSAPLHDGATGDQQPHQPQPCQRDRQQASSQQPPATQYAVLARTIAVQRGGQHIGPATQPPASAAPPPTAQHHQPAQPRTSIDQHDSDEGRNEENERAEEQEEEEEVKDAATERKAEHGDGDGDRAEEEQERQTEAGQAGVVSPFVPPGTRVSRRASFAATVKEQQQDADRSSSSRISGTATVSSGAISTASGPSSRHDSDNIGQSRPSGLQSRLFGRDEDGTGSPLSQRQSVAADSQPNDSQPPLHEEGKQPTQHELALHGATKAERDQPVEAHVAALSSLPNKDSSALTAITHGSRIEQQHIDGQSTADNSKVS